MLKLFLRLLKYKKLKLEHRALILNALLESVQALPIKDVISYDLQGTVRVNGKPLDPEKAIQLKEGAVALERNATYRLIKDQIAYEAVKMGVHSSVTLDMVVFSKAALWVQQQESKLISELSGESEEVV